MEEFSLAVSCMRYIQRRLKKIHTKAQSTINGLTWIHENCLLSGCLLKRNKESKHWILAFMQQHDGHYDPCGQSTNTEFTQELMRKQS